MAVTGKSRRAYKGAPVSNVLKTAISDSSTTITLNQTISGWPTSGTPFFIVIDPGTVKEEKVCVVYASTDTVTVVDPTVTSSWTANTAGRGADNTTPRAHDSGAVIYPVFTAYEADQANELVAKFANQGSLVYQGASTFNELAIGSANHVLRVNSGATAPEWAQVATASIADGAVSLAKLAAAVQAALNPTGAIQAYGGSSAPTGYLLCDGATFSSTTYPDLATVLGDTYGTHSGTTYYLPNLKGRVPVGRDSTQTEFDVLGETGGAKTVTLDTTMIPSHAHNISAYTHSASASTADLAHSHGVGTYAVASATTGITASTGTTGSHQHNLNYNGRAGSTLTGYAVVDGTGYTGTLIKTAEAGDHSHTVSITDSGHSHTFSGSSGAMSANGTHSHTITVSDHAAKNTDPTGGGAAHNNLQPYLVVNYIIKT